MSTAFPARVEVPGPRGWPLVGSLPDLARDVLGFWTDLARHYGDVAKYRAGGENQYLISHPALIESVFRHDIRYYYKGKYTQLLRSAFGDGLLLSSGERWRQQRQRLQPAFAESQVAAWLDSIIASVEKMFLEWEVNAATGDPLEMTHAMLKLVQTIIVKILFGSAVPYQVTAATLKAVDCINNSLWQQVLREMLLGKWFNHLPLPSNRRYHCAVDILQNTISGLLAENAHDENALIAFLARTRVKGAPAPLSDQDLRDQLITLFLAGHETTACALTWTFYYLTEHPEAAERVCIEADQTLSGSRPTSSELSRLVYTRRVIKESMRLMPPIYLIGRRCSTEVELGGWSIPAGSPLIMSQYVMHRHPRYWEMPDQFDPDHFSPERSQDRPHYAYFPFGGGPRRCLGRHLAMIEMVTILAMVMHRYRLIKIPNRRLVYRPLITLRPQAGIAVQVSLR